eukprot:scaffold39118_cov30-Prasinocladus_malaysianus.AAC.1
MTLPLPPLIREWRHAESLKCHSTSTWRRAGLVGDGLLLSMNAITSCSGYEKLLDDPTDNPNYTEINEFVVINILNKGMQNFIYVIDHYMLQSCTRKD